jgi:hypothetical protein
MTTPSRGSYSPNDTASHTQPEPKTFPMQWPICTATPLASSVSCHPILIPIRSLTTTKSRPSLSFIRMPIGSSTGRLSCPRSPYWPRTPSSPSHRNCTQYAPSAASTPLPSPLRRCPTFRASSPTRSSPSGITRTKRAWTHLPSTKPGWQATKRQQWRTWGIICCRCCKRAPSSRGFTGRMRDGSRCSRPRRIR